MAVLSLPLTFQNSFWTQDYRKGIEVLYTQLEHGIAEDDEIIAFIKARVAAENAIAATLTMAAPVGPAFDDDDRGSLLVAFRGLKEESLAQGKVHEAVAKDLQTLVAEPFEKWAAGFKERVLSSKHNLLDGWIASYEVAQGEMSRLKNDYLTKVRRADEAEDDARFAPITQPGADKYTSSPNLGPRDRRTPVRQPTMSERITQGLKTFRLGSAGTHPHAPEKPEVQFDADLEEKPTPKLDKGKGRAIDSVSPPRMASPPPMSPPLPPTKVPARLQTNPLPPAPLPPIVIAEVSFAPADLSALLQRAKSQLNLRSVRFALLGEYQECFTGEDFTVWLKDNVPDFKGSLDQAETAARELTEKHNLLRRIGELGNEYESSDEAIYQFRPKAFQLDAVVAKSEEQVLTPLQKSFSPLAENVAKGTTSFAGMVQKVLNTNNFESSYVRMRREAEAADREYRVFVRKLDRQRLGLEERIEETLKTLQKWELDRLRAVKTVLHQYHGAVSGMPKAYEGTLERSSTLIASYQPEADIKALCERFRTGPFRPEPQVYESVAHDECDVVFGIDLRKWADNALWQGPNSPEEKKDDVPPVLTLMLAALSDVYPKLPDDNERRKTWIYDVPLPAVHHLRETLNAVPPEQPLPNDVLAKYDAPVLASAVKLWLLELDPPLAMYEGWDEFRKLYPSVGSSATTEDAKSSEQHLEELRLALQKLPKVHLLVLDTIVKHLTNLIDTTSNASETHEVFVTKLALTMGRTILRPKQENEFSIQDRHPTLLFIDLLNKYADILPPTIVKKKRESERKVPVRRRTRPVDMRMSRSRLNPDMDFKEIQALQLAQRTGLNSVSSRSSSASTNAIPPVPPLPSAVQAAPAAPSVADSHTHAGEVTAEPDDIHEDAVPPPLQAPTSVPEVAAPPPPAPAPVPEVVPAPAPVAAPASTDDLPPRPAFKEPPPEDDDLPPRPNFKEPPPEEEESPEPKAQTFPGAHTPVEVPVHTPVAAPAQAVVYTEPQPAVEALPTPPSMPTFAEPPPEPEETIPSPPPSAIPSSLRRSSAGRPGSSGGRSPARQDSRSPSPSKPTTGSMSTMGPPPSGPGVGLRGPRLVRGPRPTSTVSERVSNLNARAASPGGTGTNGAGALGRSGSRTYGGHAKRGSVSRVAEFSRRTMASDAEDEVVEK